jgi:hypothetical protein
LPAHSLPAYAHTNAPTHHRFLFLHQRRALTWTGRRRHHRNRNRNRNRYRTGTGTGTGAGTTGTSGAGTGCGKGKEQMRSTRAHDGLEARGQTQPHPQPTKPHGDGACPACAAVRSIRRATATRYANTVRHTVPSRMVITSSRCDEKRTAMGAGRLDHCGNVWLTLV